MNENIKNEWKWMKKAKMNEKCQKWMKMNEKWMKMNGNEWKINGNA